MSGNFQVSKVVIYNTTAIDIDRTYYQIDDISKGRGSISVFLNRIEWQGLAETPASEFELGIHASNPYRLNIPFSSTRSVTKETFGGEDTVNVSFSVTPSQNLRLRVTTFAEETNEIYSQLLMNTATNTANIEEISSEEVEWSFGNVSAGNAYSGSVQVRATPKNSGVTRYWPYTRIQAGYGNRYTHLSSGNSTVVRYTDPVIGDVEIYFVNPVDYQISANGAGTYYQRFRQFSEIVTNGEPNTIRIDDNFKPGLRTIPAGTTVTWRNDDPISHTIVSNTGEWSSPSLGQYQQFSYTFNTLGTYEYSCSIHSSMKGKVIVTSSQAVVTTPTSTPLQPPITTPSTGGDVVSRYAGIDGIVQRSEAVLAVMDYFNSVITRQEAISVVMAYFNG